MEPIVEDVFGYEVEARILSGCIDEMVGWISKGDACRWLACLNPHSYVVSLKDEFFAKALHDADWLVPDGIGIVFASRILNGSIKERVTGNDIFSGVQNWLNRVGGFSVFFIGSTPENLAVIGKNMKRDYPGVRLAGTYSPPFKSEFSESEMAEMVEVINAASPDVLWVGMTAPKQEKWIYANKNRLNVKFAGAIGAVFDFYTGRIHRSPPIFQKLGLEWLVRLVREPRRLWRRYLVNSGIFLWRLFKEKWSKSGRIRFF